MGQTLTLEKAEYRDRSNDILQAVRQGDVKRLRSFCREHMDIDSWVRGKSLLHHAVFHRQPECVKYLISRGANSNSQSSSGATPIFEIFNSPVKRKFREATDVSMIETLLKAKADINARNSAQRTPLLKSIIDKETHITGCLLAHNAEINNIGDVDGLLPIHVSATYSSLELLKKLIHFGADINGQDQRGRTALYYSILSGHKQIFEKLIAMGCDVDICSDLGCPLQVAIVSGQGDMVQTLLENGASVGCSVHESRFSLRKATDILNLSLTVVQIKLTKSMGNSSLPNKDVLKALDILDMVIQAYGSTVVISHNAFFQNGFLHSITDNISDAKVLHKLHTIYQKLGFVISMCNQKLPPGLQTGIFKIDKEYQNEALTLQNLCRMRVRGLVMRSRTNVIAAVRKLDCSFVIKDILLLKDIFNLSYQ